MKPQITHTSAKAFGDVFALYQLWTELGFDRALQRAMLTTIAARAP